MAEPRLFDALHRKLDRIAAQDLTRFLRAAESPTAPRQRVRGPDGLARELLLFCANDYLGLAAHPRIAQALAEGAEVYGGGSGASHLISGHSVAHERLEQALAAWYLPHIPQARALSFSTGYMANLAVVTALAGLAEQPGEAEIFSEALNHASLIDACRLARGAKLSRYAHADMAALRAQLQASTAAVKIIVSDAVFSMDGDIAPASELLRLAEEFEAWLVLDDAHGFGVLGRQGRGCLEHFDLRSERLLLVGTLGKAAGLAGAFVAGHHLAIELLLQSARSYIFTTAALPAVAHALLTSLDLIESETGQQRRARLLQLQARLREGVNQRLLPRRPAWRLADSETPIQPLIIGGNAEVMRLAAALERRGLRVPGIRPPTVPAGEARLRITLCATHTDADVERLLSALEASP
jgi:8-amino-7-oxononanoate synthase